jgi:hypothetical protein
MINPKSLIGTLCLSKSTHFGCVLHILCTYIFSKAEFNFQIFITKFQKGKQTEVKKKHKKIFFFFNCNTFTIKFRVIFTIAIRKKKEKLFVGKKNFKVHPHCKL